MQDLYLHFSQITRLDGVFLVQYCHFPSSLPQHHTEGRDHCCAPMKGSLWQAQKEGMWQILDAPPSPALAGSALTKAGARVGRAAAPGGIIPAGSSFCSSPFLTALHSNLGFWATCCWSPLLCLSSWEDGFPTKPCLTLALSL